MTQIAITMKLIPLGNAAIEYLHSTFSESELMFGHTVVDQLDIDYGQAFVWIPADRDAKEFQAMTVKDLQHGHSISREKSVNALAIYIHDRLNKGTTGLCLFENQLAYPFDPWLNRCKSKVVVVQGEVFHVVLGSTLLTVNEVVTAIDESDSYRLFGGISAIPDAEKVAGKSILTIADLKDIVAHTESIIMSVFDGESFIVWHPHVSENANE